MRLSYSLNITFFTFQPSKSSTPQSVGDKGDKARIVNEQQQSRVNILTQLVR